MPEPAQLQVVIKGAHEVHLQRDLGRLIQNLIAGGYLTAQSFKEGRGGREGPDTFTTF